MKSLNIEKTAKVVMLVFLDAALCFFAFVFASWLMCSTIYREYVFPGGILRVSSDTLLLHQYFTIPQVAFFIPIYIVSFAVFGLYNGIWTFSGLKESAMIIVGVGSGTALSLFMNWTLSYAPYFNKIGFLDSSKPGVCMAGMVLCVGIYITRFGYRSVRRLVFVIGNRRHKGKKLALIVGAGYFGAYVHSQLAGGYGDGAYYTAAFVDDDPVKIGTRVGGVKVVGATDDIPDIVRRMGITDIIIAIPSITAKRQAEIIAVCCSVKSSVKRIIPMRELNNAPTAHDIRDTSIGDILFRPEVELDKRSIKEYIERKCVLVTGGGGSIGSEICRQIAAFYPSKLVVFDIYENNAYELMCELNGRYPRLNISVRIGSVRDKARIDAVMDEFKPDIVLHTAAHKHVPLMEDSPAEAVKNNVFGACNVLKSADEHGVKIFVQLSTDKAVNPTNVMGATKRITEIIVQQYAKKSGMCCMTVRFGNVLGSNGSVIHLFENQIRNGGPVLVTDRNITRYFMTITEAAQLVLQAGALCESGAIYVLDMGEPVRIYELAEKVIRFHGFEPNVDMPIKIIGLRPGEKMHEELLTNEEQNAMEKTAHGRIFKARPAIVNSSEFDLQLEKLKKLAEANSMGVVDCLEEIVPNFKREEGRGARSA